MRASLIESVRLAFDALRSSKLRSILTLVGIILSTWTLIAVIALIHGMDVYVANSASNMGNDGFRVLRAAFTGIQNARKFFEAQQRNPQLTREEYAFIKSRARLVREIGISGTRSATVTYGATSGGGSGATAPTSIGAQTWQAQERSTGGGSLTNLASSPSISTRITRLSRTKPWAGFVSRSISWWGKRNDTTRAR